MSWEKAWREGRTGWDAGAPAPSLVHLVDSGALATVDHTLVPGCGAGYDAVALAELSSTVVGVDLAPSAANRFDEVRAEGGLSSDQLGLHIGDFFGPIPGTPAAGFDRVWDYTFLCALPLTMRESWAARMAALIRPQGELITLIFPSVWVRGEDRSSPPFRLLPDEVSALLAQDFEEVSMSLVPASLSHSGREGLETLARWVRRT